MEFDRILVEAEALAAERPLRTSLDRREIERIAKFFYAHELAADEEERRDDGSDFGLSDRQMNKIDETVEIVFPAAQHDLARGNISMLRWEVDELLSLFRINLDAKSTAYRELGIEVLKTFVRALQAIERRQKGEPVDTPELPVVTGPAPATGETLRAALGGWKKARRRPPNTLREFVYAVDRFVEVHGDMPAIKITRKHVREFREALQRVPLRRSGELRSAMLPELVDWSQRHEGVPRVSAAT
jgi:hypothetical protein